MTLNQFLDDFDAMIRKHKPDPLYIAQNGRTCIGPQRDCPLMWMKQMNGHVGWMMGLTEYWRRLGMSAQDIWTVIASADNRPYPSAPWTHLEEVSSYPDPAVRARILKSCGFGGS